MSVESNEWSSAVGRASTGKSGRVIEKLMGEVEKLRRENKLLTVKYDEEARRSESARSLAESLQVSNANLSSICESHNTALARKDRKIDELKADLEAEHTRRVRTEAENKAISQERDEVVAVCKKELLEEKEVARKSSSQYEALSSSWRRLDDGYRRQVEKLQQDLKALEKRRVEDSIRFEEFSSTFSILTDQAAASKAERDHILEQFDQYKQDKEDSIREMREAAEKSQVDNEKALQEMRKVVGEMRYVINVKRDVKGLD
jgi:DNA repair exonuclease SbcCD ATPase subunit